MRKTVMTPTSSHLSLDEAPCRKSLNSVKGSTTSLPSCRNIPGGTLKVTAVMSLGALIKWAWRVCNWPGKRLTSSAVSPVRSSGASTGASGTSGATDTKYNSMSRTGDNASSSLIVSPLRICIKFCICLFQVFEKNDLNKISYCIWSLRTLSKIIWFFGHWTVE